MSYPGVDTYTTTVDAECEDCEIQWEQEVEVERGLYLTKCPKCGHESNKEASE
jgi:Zn finger protein HypA/HybF involved in hydrogenase expression